jgi:hypothetical protein
MIRPSRRSAAVLALLVSACAPAAVIAPASTPPAATFHEAFWNRLQALCDNAFAGRVVAAPEDDSWWRAERIVMHVRECDERTIRIPLHIDANRSRTWVVTRTDAGLRLEHDHRLADGAPDTSNTGYGGAASPAASAERVEFPADAYSIGVVPARASQHWYLELRPGEQFVYGLLREATGMRYRVEFDLARPVGPPPPPWGAAGRIVERGVEAATGPERAPTFGEAVAAGRATVSLLFVPAGGFAYRDAAGAPTGVTAELLRDFARWVAREHGLDLELRWIEEEAWSRFYGLVRDSRGGVFGVGNVTITDARRGELAFSPPYLRNIAVLVTHDDVPELPALEEIGGAFAGLTALRYEGTLHEARLVGIRERHFPSMRFRPVATNDETIALLASGEGYFGYVDVYNFWRARQAGLPLRRHPAGDDAAETFGVIMPHGSDWAPVLDAFFAADGGYVQGARFRGLLREHLGEELASLLAGGPGGDPTGTP